MPVSRWAVAGVATAALATLALHGSPWTAAADPLILAVPGHINTNVSLATRDAWVAAAWSASTEAGGTDIYLALSTDGGVTFGEPHRVNDVVGATNPSGEQPPRVAIGERAIHVIWPAKRGQNAIAYANSTDGGNTFSAAVHMPASGLPGARGWASLAVAPQGVVHMVWLDGRAAAAAGVTGSPGAADPQQDVYHASWRVGTGVVQTRIAENVCFCCKTAVAVSGSDVYAAWRQIYAGSIRDIAFARSSDAGATFREPVRVSVDNWKLDGCPDDGPAVVVDSRGTVRVAWPTLIAGSTPRKAIFYSMSRDGYRFSPRTRLDTATADPAHPQIALERGNTVGVVWDEVVDGTRRVLLRRVGPSDELGPVEIVTVEQGATYPAIAATQRDLLVAWTGGPSDARVIKIRRLPLSR